MKEYLLRATISPFLEQQLIQKINFVSTAKALNRAFGFLKSFRGSTLLIIPVEYKYIFQTTPQLRPLLEILLSDPQSNVIFAPTTQKVDCLTGDAKTLFEDRAQADFSNRQSLNAMYGLRFPIYVDASENVVNKLACIQCAGRRRCSLEFSQKTISFSEDEVTLEAAFKENAKKALEDLPRWIQERVSLEQLKAIALIQAVSDSAEHKILFKVESLDVIEGFLDDIQDQKSEVLINIAYTMFRALAYPSSNDRSKRHPQSIDWHPNNPKSFKDIELFRCDVLDAKRSGLTGSGANRLLLGRKQGRMCFLAFTDEHDFSRAIVDARAALLSERNE